LWIEIEIKTRWRIRTEVKWFGTGSKWWALVNKVITFVVKFNAWNLTA